MEDRTIRYINMKLDEMTPGQLDQMYNHLKWEQNNFIFKYKEEISKEKIDKLNDEELLKQAFKEYEKNNPEFREEYLALDNKYKQEIGNGNLIKYKVGEISEILKLSNPEEIAVMYDKKKDEQDVIISSIIDKHQYNTPQIDQPVLKQNAPGYIPEEKLYKLAIKEYASKDKYKIFRAEYSAIKEVHLINEKNRKHEELLEKIEYMQDDKIKEIQYEKIEAINIKVEGYKKDILTENNQAGKTETGEKVIKAAFWKFLNDTSNNQLTEEYTAIKNRMKELGITKDKAETLQKEPQTTTASMER